MSSRRAISFYFAVSFENSHVHRHQISTMRMDPKQRAMCEYEKPEQQIFFSLFLSISSLFLSGCGTIVCAVLGCSDYLRNLCEDLEFM